MSSLIIVPALSMNFFTADDKRYSFKQKIDSSDFYMHNATLNKFNDHGKLAHKLEAKSFSYYPERKQTDLIQPSLNIAGEKINVLWEITAKKGKITSGRNVTQEIVEFWDKVSATTRNNGRKFTNVKTEKMIVYPEKKYIETSSNVYIDNEMGRTSASGMKAFLDSGHYVFYSSDKLRVSTIFLP